jgi:hypothetical protein
MTMPDLPERSGQASETRQTVERGRTETGAEVSGRAFIMDLLAIATVVLPLLAR